MKKYIMSVILIVGMNIVSQAQIYVQGRNVVPFSTTANSTLLNPTNRLDMDTAFTKLKQFDKETRKKAANEILGEFWLIDGMLVKIVARHITATYPKENLEHVRYAITPSVNSIVGGAPPDRTVQNDYFSEVKSVNNYDVLVHYFRTRSNIKHFEMQDHKDKYKVFGSVYTNDHQKAHKLINTLINSITFK